MKHATPPSMGVLVLNKPAGLTSHDVVAQVRRIVAAAGVNKPPKVGHTGTLDPFATGVLVVAVGQATRLIQYTHALDKEYRVVVRLGATSDTDDGTGTIVPSTSLAMPSTAQIEEVLKNWRGNVLQRPPAYAAVKIDGERAYKRARAGESVVLPSRPVTIHELELVRWKPPHLTLRIVCSTGTYIRSLARDIGTELAVGGLAESLTRTRIGDFLLADAQSLESPKTGLQFEPADRLVAHLPQVALAPQQAAAFNHGQMVAAPPQPHNRQALVVARVAAGRLLGVGCIEDDLLRPRVVFLQSGP